MSNYKPLMPKKEIEKKKNGRKKSIKTSNQ